MSGLHIFVGDTGIELSHCALAYNSLSYLVDKFNVNNTHTGTVYTSLGDLDNCVQLINLLSTASEITYCPPRHWSDGKKSLDKYSLPWFTEHYIGIAVNLCNIKLNGSISSLFSMPSTVDTRKTSSPQLWVAGCSTTFGVGVENNKRYADILSTHLDLPLSLLAQPGASIPWASDQILRSDIRKNDLVILGLSNYQRLTVFNSNAVIHVVSQLFVDYKNKLPELNIDQFDSDTRIYESISAVNQVINFCSKIGAKLIIIGIHTNLELLPELTKLKNFIFYHGKFGTDANDGWLDLGSDGVHPGTKTHQLYADLIISKAKDLNFI
jgi:hypothetical protein